MTLKCFPSHIYKKKIFKTGVIVTLVIILPLDACKDIKCLNAGNCTAGKCNCDIEYTGETCQVNVCERIDCQNDGICMVNVIEGISAPTCQCRRGWSDQTKTEISWFHGESCRMPGPDLCYASPCQNNGICTSESQLDNTQVVS